MRKFFRNPINCAVPLLAFGMVLSSAAVRADSIGQSLSFVFTTDDCGGGCGLDGNEKVKVTVNNIVGTVETLEISATLPSNWHFISTGASGNDQFSFALNAIASLSFSNSSNGSTGTTWSTSAWTPTPSSGSASATSPQTVNGQSISYPGKGTFGPDGYSMEWNGGNGNSSTNPSSLDFFVSGTGLTLASLQACTGCGVTGGFFIADIYSDATGNTGLVVATPLVVVTPTASVPGPIAGAGLPGLILALGGLLAWRRKRKGAASIAA